MGITEAQRGALLALKALENKAKHPKLILLYHFGFMKDFHASCKINKNLMKV